MKPVLSTYLDLVRYFAALVVFIGHAAGRQWTGGLLWQFGGYGQTAVMVFFVLSGFVVAYVVDTREQQAAQYAASRLARLWSVTLPALALTFVIDFIGVRVAPDLYIGRPWYHGDEPLLRYVASGLFVHDFWDAGLTPGVNGPFWSISYEAAYYLIFGLAYFVRQWIAKVALLMLAMGMAGPTIVAMVPIWLLGVATYHLSRRTQVPALVGWPLLFASLGLLLSAPSVRDATAGYSIAWVHRDRIVADYVDAIAFSANILAFISVSSLFEAYLLRVRPVIAYLATTTFALYLFHRPLLQFFAYLLPGPPEGAIRRVLIFVGIPAVVLLMTPPTEWLKGWMRPAILSLLSRPGRATGGTRVVP